MNYGDDVGRWQTYLAKLPNELPAHATWATCFLHIGRHEDGLYVAEPGALKDCRSESVALGADARRVCCVFDVCAGYDICEDVVP